MTRGDLRDAKAHLGEPVAEHESGTSVAEERRQIVLQELEELTASMEEQPASAGDFLRRMRDESRY